MAERRDNRDSWVLKIFVRNEITLVKLLRNMDTLSIILRVMKISGLGKNTVQSHLERTKLNGYISTPKQRTSFVLVSF